MQTNYEKEHFFAKHFLSVQIWYEIWKYTLQKINFLVKSVHKTIHKISIFL